MELGVKTMNDDTPKRLYIITVNQDIWYKRFYFEGDDNEAAAKQFAHAAEFLDEISEKHKDWVDFLNAVVDHFKKFGFIRIKK